MNVAKKNIYILSGIVLFITSYFSVGYHHFDEHFQILEFAGSQLGLTTTENLPWEYHHQMRSALQPMMVIGLYRLFDFLELANPFFITFFLRFFSAILAFLSFFLMYKAHKDKITNGRLQKWFLVLSFLLWFGIYNSVRFSSENWSGIFFLLGYSSYFLVKIKKKLHYLGIGLLFGFSFLFRFQTGFLVFGFLSWLIFLSKENRAKILFIILGILLTVGLGILIDKTFYGEWTLTAWNYLEQVIVGSKEPKFKEYPWWWYFTTVFVKAIPPFSLLYIASILLIFRYRFKSPIVWTMSLFLIIHFLIGHKEIRFLFPLIGFLPIVIIHGFEIILEKFDSNFILKRSTKRFMKFFFIIHFILLIIVMFKPADSQIKMYNKLYTNYKTPTTLYYISANPYYRVLDIHFYKRQNLTIKKIDSIDDIQFSKNEKSLIVLTQKDKSIPLNPKSKLIYTSHPNWMKHFNFTDWMSRTAMWKVYECQYIHIK